MSECYPSRDDLDWRPEPEPKDPCIATFQAQLRDLRSQLTAALEAQARAEGERDEARRLADTYERGDSKTATMFSQLTAENVTLREFYADVSDRYFRAFDAVDTPLTTAAAKRMEALERVAEVARALYGAGYWSRSREEGFTEEGDITYWEAMKAALAALDAKGDS